MRSVLHGLSFDPENFTGVMLFNGDGQRTSAICRRSVRTRSGGYGGALDEADEQDHPSRRSPTLQLLISHESLDQQLWVPTHVEISPGTVAQPSVYPQEVMRMRCLKAARPSCWCTAIPRDWRILPGPISPDADAQGCVAPSERAGARSPGRGRHQARTAVLGGERTTLQIAHFRLSHSRALLVRA